MMNQKNLKQMGSKWIETDGDTGQYGRKISDWEFEFKEGLNGVEKNMIIDLRKYTVEQVESCINSYGYSLGWKVSSNIYDMYGDESSWIVAECLFETQN